MQKRFHILVVLLLFCSIGITAQNLHTKPFFDKLDANLTVIYSGDLLVTEYCEKYEKNINSFQFQDIKIYIQEEEYVLNKTSLDFYNGFKNLNYKSKCRLVYAWAQIKPIIINESSPLKTAPQIAFLPVVISAFDKYYSDQNGGFGLWGLQYLPATRYGIVADSSYDERLDLKKSSYAAQSYLSYLHKSFDSWDYAVTAYVCGPAKLRKAMQGTSSFDEVIVKLDDPAKNTFYILLALIRWMGENETIAPAEIFVSSTKACDTVIVDRRMHFAQISGVLNIELKTLQNLNPLFVGNVIDGRQKAKTIFLPLNQAGNFIKFQDSICNFNDSIYFPKYKPVEKRDVDNEPVYYEAYESVSPGDDFEEIKYKIVSGDNLGSIAEKYKVKVSDLQDWNNISGTGIYAGQQISIWVKKGTAASYTTSADTQKTTVKADNVKTDTQKKETSSVKKAFEPKEYTIVDTYIVKSGDSAYKIAQKYSWATAEDILSWNNISDPSKLQVGQKLKIYKKK